MKTLVPFQKIGVDFLLSRQRCLLGDDMGCLSGKTELIINRNGGARRRSIEWLFRNFSPIDPIQSRVKSMFPYGSLRLNTIKKVLYKGKQQTYLVRCRGYSLVCTFDHEIATPDGFKELRQLQAGSKILVNGKTRCKHCRKYTTVVTYKYAKFKGVCKRCMYCHLRTNGKGWHYDNRICNLEIVNRSDHAKIHANENTINLHAPDKNCWFYVHESTIISIKPHKIEDVYDLVMESPARNFVANGVIVHNCGKTVQAVSAAIKLPGDVQNILVVAPASLLLQWEYMINDWLPPDVSRTIIQLKMAKSEVRLTGRYRFVLVSYNYMREHWGRLSRVKWHCIIADEAQALKNWRSATAKAFRTLTKKHQGYVWFLTGTPATRGGDDYYAFLELIQPGKWGSLSAFREMFCDCEIDYMGHRTYHGVKEKMRPILRKAFSKVMLRRLKKDVLKELPSIVSSIVPVELDAKILKELHDIPQSYVEHAITTGSALSEHVMRDLHLIGVGKVPAALEYLTGVADEQVVVFCRHMDVLQAIENGLKTDGRTVTVFHGQLGRSAKDDSVSRFVRGEAQYIVCNIKSAGVGLNLQCASHMLIVEQDWSPAIMDQAIARIDRMGQTASHLTVTHLIAEKTVDTHVLDVLKYKSQFIAAVMGDLWK